MHKMAPELKGGTFFVSILGIKRAGGILRYRVRISHGDLSLSLSPFVYQLQNCMKSYGRGDENSYKKTEPPKTAQNTRETARSARKVLSLLWRRPEVF